MRESMHPVFSPRKTVSSQFSCATRAPSSTAKEGERERYMFLVLSSYVALRPVSSRGKLGPDFLDVPAVLLTDLLLVAVAVPVAVVVLLSLCVVRRLREGDGLCASICFYY